MYVVSSLFVNLSIAISFKVIFGLFYIILVMLCALLYWHTVGDLSKTTWWGLVSGEAASPCHFLCICNSMTKMS